MTNQKIQQAAASDQYRLGAGIVLLNTQSEVLVGRRADLKNDAWQMPQGGIIDPGETPLQAAMRELKEEIGTDKADFIAESRGWFQYDVPPALAPKRWAGRWKGQRQKWLVMLFRGTDEDIKLPSSYPEFDAWRWVPVQDLPELAVSFKRQLYLDVIGEFSTIFRD
jgi:putative (di)nucleoside polyphosphate hydrolase